MWQRNDSPIFHIVAGVNGAGKSTIIRSETFPRDGYLNPDVISKSINRFVFWPLISNWIAVEYLEYIVDRSIVYGKNICVETVLSSKKYLPYVKRAKDAGFITKMTYVAITNVEQSVERVKSRVAAGLHGVPENKIRDRWSRSLDNLAEFVPLIDELIVYDNSDYKQPVLVGCKRNDRVIIVDRYRLPEITKRLETK